MPCNFYNVKKKLLENEDFLCSLGSKLYFLCTNEECPNRTHFFSTPVFKDKSAFQINTISVVGMRSIGRGRSAALKLFLLMNLVFPLSQPSSTKQTNLLVSESGKIKQKNIAQACYEVKQKISETHHLFSPKIMDTGISFYCSWNICG